MNRLLALVTIAGLAGLANADVLVVNGLGGTPWQNIQSAVDAASNGDTILVRDGVYDGFEITGKGVRVVAVTSQAVQVFGNVTVRDVAAGELALLAGLELDGVTLSAGIDPLPLRIQSNAGSVRVQDCRILAAPGNPQSCVGIAGVRVESSSDVAFTACDLAGSDANSNAGGRGGHGLVATDGSRVACYDGIARGGKGDSCVPCSPTLLCPQPPPFPNWCPPGGQYPDGSFGGNAYEGTAFLFASNSQFTGGGGGNARGLGSSEGLVGGYGGAGIRACSVGSAAWLLDVTLQGGAAGGCDVPVLCSNGQPGAGSQASDGATLGSFSGESRTIAGPNVVREGDSIVLQLIGARGDAVDLFFGKTGDFRFVPALRGVKLVRDAKRVRLGKIGSSGVRTYTLPVADLGKGVSSKTFHFQSLHRATNGRATLGSALTVVAIDTSI